jgi:predicted phage baseplate assembly protein
MYSRHEVDLSGCDCCGGIAVETPVQIRDLPGLSAIAYRVGTYTQFLSSMQSRLADSALPGLNALKTRQPDDFTIALLDSWSMVCDVLTFYQERIANESYKRTATERSSLLELARLVRYNLQPGVAADTYLVYTLDETPGSPGQAIINIGTQAQSLPGPGEQPQVFETTESIVARAQWNAIKPLATKTQPIFPSTKDIWVKGTNTNLKPGDMVLVLDTGDNPQKPLLLRVQNIAVDTVVHQSHVLFEGYQPSATASPATTLLTAPATPALSSPRDASKKRQLEALQKQQLYEDSLKKRQPLTAAFKQRLPLTDDLARQLASNGASQSDLETLAIFQGWSVNNLFAAIAAQSSAAGASSNGPAFTNPGIFALRQHASLFGNNAPDWRLMPDQVRSHYIDAYHAAGGKDPSNNYTWTDWPHAWPGLFPNAPDVPKKAQQLDLDRIYSQIFPENWIVIESPGAEPEIVQVSQAQETTIADFGLNLKITHLELHSEIDLPKSMSDLRKVTIFIQSEPLNLVEIPETQPIQKDTIIVNGILDGLYAGRRMVVTGITDSLSSASTIEFVLLNHTQPLAGKRTMLYLKNGGLVNSYIPSSVTINANVVAATQGESVKNEALGSGDATQPFQSFTLRQSPLTYVQAPTQDGKASTLQVFVNGIQWLEVDAFYGHGSLERIFVTHIGDDGKATVQFGDGRTGARLPTGEDNVTAFYRIGAGTQGLVKPGQISLLKTRPLGVKGVSNPLMPTGAIDPDTIDDARRNADNTVRTLGRIVSRADYEDFARSYAAVDKALANIIWNNMTKSVFVTIAGTATPDKPFGVEIVEGSGLYNKIYGGMRKASDPTIPFFLLSYTTRTFRLAARVKVDPNVAPGNVLRDVQHAVLADFSFSARTFGQDVILKEVIASAQKVPGVVTMRFYAFYRTDDPPGEEPDPDIRLDENLSLPAALPQVQDTGTVSLAELLVIDPNAPFDLLEVMP